MKPELQIKALAELDGWRFIRVEKGPYNSAGYRIWLNDTEKGGFSDYQGFECIHILFHVPAYLTSYDAIIPLIQKQDWKTKCEIVIQLRIKKQESFVEIPTMDNLEGWCVVVLGSTPSQLCEALLRATNKWIEE